MLLVVAMLPYVAISCFFLLYNNNFKNSQSLTEVRSENFKKKMFQIQNDWGQQGDAKCWFAFRASTADDAKSVHAQLLFDGNGQPKAFDDDRFVLTPSSSSTSSSSSFHVRDKESNHEVDIQRATSSFKIGSTALSCIDVNVSGELGVVGDEQGTISIFDANDGTVRCTLPNAHLLDVYRTAFFPSGQVILSCGGDMLLKVWDANEGVLACTLRGHKAGVLSQCIIDRGRNVVSASRDGSVKVWEVSSQQCVRTFELGAGAVHDCATALYASSAAGENTQAQARSGEHFQNGQVVLSCSESASLHLLDLRIEQAQAVGNVQQDRASALVACALNVTNNRAYTGSINGWLSEFDLRSFSR